MEAVLGSGLWAWNQISLLFRWPRLFIWTDNEYFFLGLFAQIRLIAHRTAKREKVPVKCQSSGAETPRWQVPAVFHIASNARREHINSPTRLQHMADDDLRALVDSLDDASQEDLAKVIANFSVDMLQRASALIGAQQGSSGGQLQNRTLQCQQQQQREEEQASLEALASGGKRVSLDDWAWVGRCRFLSLSDGWGINSLALHLFGYSVNKIFNAH